MVKEKHALLDTDFISKMHLIRKDNQNKMIDCIMKMPNYRFYCHEQIRIELGKYNSGSASEWLDQMIHTGRIICYTDSQIIDQLMSVYGKMASSMYIQLLKNACDAYKAGYFRENFLELQKSDYTRLSKEEFLIKLQADCDLIGTGQNIGELKTYVLLQVINLKLGEQIYVFCSDDKNARNGIVSIGGVRCISVLSSFLRLQKECGLKKEDAEPYVQSYLRLCKESNQTTFRIQDTSKEKRFCKVPCEQVLNEIFDGKLEELRTGNLRYIHYENTPF